MAEPRLIVVAGLPGAGKTTTARRLAERLPRAAHVEADLLQHLVVSGGVWPEAREMSDEARTQLRLRLHHAGILARSFVAAGFDAVIDDIVVGARVDDLLEELSGSPFHFVMLHPAFEQVVERWQAIGSPYIDAWTWMEEEIDRHTRRIGLWIDTTDLDPDEVVDTILRRLDEAAVTPDRP